MADVSTYGTAPSAENAVEMADGDDGVMDDMPPLESFVSQQRPGVSVARPAGSSTASVSSSPKKNAGRSSPDTAKCMAQFRRSPQPYSFIQAGVQRGLAPMQYQREQQRQQQAAAIYATSASSPRPVSSTVQQSSRGQANASPDPSVHGRKVHARMVAPATGSGLTRTTEDLDMPRVLWSERQPGEVPRPVAERQQLTTASPVVLPDPEAVMQDVAKQSNNKVLPRWVGVHRKAGPCSKCFLCHRVAKWMPRLYTHPMQWTSPQLQALVASKGIQPHECVCRQCMLHLMAVLATPASRGVPSASASTSLNRSSTKDKPASPTLGVNGRPNTGSSSSSRYHSSSNSSLKRTSTEVSEASDFSSSEGEDDSDGDRTYRMKKSTKRQPQSADNKVPCAYPKCPEPARHHIGKRSHPAAATLLSLSWDVIKASCDSSGRLPLCNEHHKTINQLNGPNAKRYGSKSSVQDLVSEQFRAEDFAAAHRPSHSSTSSTVRRQGRKKGAGTNTALTRALRNLPKAVERPERTYCGLVRMPVTCLLPASHDMNLDRTVPHAAPEDSEAGVPSLTDQSDPAVPDQSLVHQRMFTRRLYNCTPVDMVTGEAIPDVQLLYPGDPPPPVDPKFAAAVKVPTNPPPPAAPATAHQAGKPRPTAGSLESASSKHSSPAGSHVPPRPPTQHPERPAPASNWSPSSSSSGNAVRSPAQQAPVAAVPKDNINHRPIAVSSAMDTAQRNRGKGPASSWPSIQAARSQQQQHSPMHRATVGTSGGAAVSSPRHGPQQASPQGRVSNHHSPPLSYPMHVPSSGPPPPASEETAVPYFHVNGIREHLDIPAHLTDLDIQKQEEKVRELMRKLQQAAAR